MNISGEECKNFEIFNFFFLFSLDVFIFMVFYMIILLIFVVKFGVEFFGCVGLVKYVKEVCLNFEFFGLMMIGMVDYILILENFKVYII